MRRDFHHLRQPEVVIIPMIDIMLFLLVFFMLSTMYMVNTNTVQVSLPQAAAAAQETRPNVVSITVTEKGDVLFDRETQPTTQLSASIADALAADEGTVFVLRGDRKADYERVVAVLDALKQAGARHVSIATEAKGGGR